jgi:hypothetical protein
MLMLLMLPFLAHSNGYPIDEFESGVYIGKAIKSDAISIENETLTIDLTSLPKNKISSIHASYNLMVDTLFDSLKIAFISHQLLNNQVQIILDGVPIEIMEIRVDSLPSYLTIPQFTPAFNPDENSKQYDMELDSTGYILFQINRLTKGEHTLEVQYSLKPAILHKDFGSLTRIWQISYALSPAKYWKSFNHLHVKVMLPKNWELTSNLDLNKDGNDLIGSFNHIPIDNLLISARMKGDSVFKKIHLFKTLLFVILAILIIFALFKLIQKQYDQPKYALKLGLFILFTAILIPLVWFFAELSIIPTANYFLDGQVNQNLLDQNGYGLIMYAAFFTPVIFFISALILGILSVIFSFRRHKVNKIKPL